MKDAATLLKGFVIGASFMNLFWRWADNDPWGWWVLIMLIGWIAYVMWDLGWFQWRKSR